MDYINIDLNLLQTFVVVYENKSILLASEKLFVSQPAISISIKKLEDFLGGKLFVRTSKGVIPTIEGEVFYTHIKIGLSNFKNGFNHFSNVLKKAEGSIKLGSRSTKIRHILLPFIDVFGKKYPDIHISIIDDLSDSLLDDLKNGLLDISIVSTPMNDLNKYNVTPIKKVHDCFIAPYDFEKDFISKKDFQNYDLVIPKYPAKNRLYFDEVCKNEGLKITPMYEMFSFGLITDFVKKTKCIGFTIKEFNEKEIKNKEIKIIKTDFNLQPRDVLALTMDTSVNNFACNLFLKEMTEYFKDK